MEKEERYWNSLWTLLLCVCLCVSVTVNSHIRNTFLNNVSNHTLEITHLQEIVLCM